MFLRGLGAILFVCTFGFADDNHYKITFDDVKSDKNKQEVLISSRGVSIDGKKYPINFVELADVKECGDGSIDVYGLEAEDRGLEKFIYADIKCDKEVLYAAKLKQEQNGTLTLLSQKTKELKSKDEIYEDGWFKTISLKDDEILFKERFALGRLLGATTYLMPDNRTLYIGDGKSGMLFMFTSDRSGNFESGRLYGAKIDKDGVSWIDLGHSTSSQIARFVTESEHRLSFEDMFEEESVGGNPCSNGFLRFEDRCLKAKDNVKKITSRLEPTKYALQEGVSSELTGLSGISYDLHRNRLFISINSSDMHPCGALFSLSTGGNKKDDKNEHINSGFIAFKIDTLLSKDELAQGCANSGVANPGKIAFMDGSDSLIISKSGVNGLNDVWSYDLFKKRSNKIKNLQKESVIEQFLWSPRFGNYGYMFSAISYKKEDGKRGVKLGYTGAFPYLP